jgi:hypothetical protein
MSIRTQRSFCRSPYYRDLWLNISALLNSIVNKVRYVVEEATGLDVHKVNVYVDAMIHD